MRTIGLILMTAVANFAVAADAPRLSGGGALRPTSSVVSADGRFSLEADLRAADRPQSGGRYVLDGRLAASLSKENAILACAAGGVLFANGFE